MNIRPLWDKVVLKKVEMEVKTKSGLILSSAAAASEEQPLYEVVAAGEGLRTEGKVQPMSVKKGEKVFIEKYAGNAVKLDGDEYLIVHEHEILAVVE